VTREEVDRVIETLEEVFQGISIQK
jgi:hypothetical protein